MIDVVNDGIGRNGDGGEAKQVRRELRHLGVRVEEVGVVMAAVFELHFELKNLEMDEF